eukprot:1210524-Rhodomonas_salina.3
MRTQGLGPPDAFGSGSDYPRVTTVAGKHEDPPQAACQTKGTDTPRPERARPTTAPPKAASSVPSQPASSLRPSALFLSPQTSAAFSRASPGTIHDDLLPNPSASLATP